MAELLLRRELLSLLLPRRCGVNAGSLLLSLPVQEAAAMPQGIVRMCLVLMAVASVRLPLQPKAQQEMESLQRMKEREARLRLHRLLLEKEIAALEALEAPQEAPAPAAEQQPEEQQRSTAALLALAGPVLLVLGRQRLRGAAAQLPGQGHAGPGLLGTACKGMALLRELLLLLRAMAISMGRALPELRGAAAALLPLPILADTKQHLGLH
ncbi:uncharacterized protein LOC111930469 [Cyanistes caeruleus]|uniref:uncharacterized protein LOC111930469 n=1 Tax=Cyanistes caeruleus TaxID=156563 RepID=UPI000CDB5ACB|nr:uncharacterized protein LOC111930469 [Cyanistes caeruleus]